MRSLIHTNSHQTLQLLAINESPVLLLLNPRVDHTRKDLPVALYETGGCWQQLPALLCCCAMVLWSMSVLDQAVNYGLR